MQIEMMIHRCIIQNGDAAGNRNEIAVTSYAIEHRDVNQCLNCGEAIAPSDNAILAYLYQQLTGV